MVDYKKYVSLDLKWCLVSFRDVICHPYEQETEVSSVTQAELSIHLQHLV